MAAIPAANLAQALNVTFRNIIDKAAGDLEPRLTTWRDEFFAALDFANPAETLIYRWIVPTNKLLLSIPAGISTGGYQAQFSVATSICQLVQQTIYAARFNGFTPPAALDTALTTAFNNAWTI